MAFLHRFPTFLVLPAPLTSSRFPLPVFLVLAAAPLSSFFCPHPDVPTSYLPLPSTLRVLQPQATLGLTGDAASDVLHVLRRVYESPANM